MNATSPFASSFSQRYEALCAACDRIAPDALAGVRGQASATTKVRNDLFGIALRLMSSDGTFEQAEVDALAEYGDIPVINGLTDYCHPCQVLADLMTIRNIKEASRETNSVTLETEII